MLKKRLVILAGDHGGEVSEAQKSCLEGSPACSLSYQPIYSSEPLHFSFPFYPPPSSSPPIYIYIYMHNLPLTPILQPPPNYMGICQSSDVVSQNTAKVVMPDGKLSELRQPTRAREVVESSCPGCFVCDSDDLDFGGEVVPLPGDEVLLPGQLYFALPDSWLHRPLVAEEMAALAVKASSALGKAGVGRRRSGGCRGSSVVVPSATEGRRRSSSCDTWGGDGGRRRRGPGGRGIRCSFELKLSAIPE